jgi:hypothetical protein
MNTDEMRLQRPSLGSGTIKAPSHRRGTLCRFRSINRRVFSTLPPIGVILLADSLSKSTIMIKTMCIAWLLVCSTSLAWAQTPTTKTSTKTTKTGGPPKVSTVPTTSTAKTSSTVAGPTKKNGTPDMRYKSNKDAAKTPTTTHLTKSGQPDKRYKENKTTK